MKLHISAGHTIKNPFNLSCLYKPSIYRGHDLERQHIIAELQSHRSYSSRAGLRLGLSVDGSKWISVSKVISNKSANQQCISVNTSECAEMLCSTMQCRTTEELHTSDKQCVKTVLLNQLIVAQICHLMSCWYKTVKYIEFVLF